MKECRIHRLEIRIAASAVNNGVELRVQRDRMPAGRNSKVGRIGFSMHGNVAESSRVLASGRQNASNAFDRAQVGVSEGIIPLHRCVSRTVLLPRPEQTCGL